MILSPLAVILELELYSEPWWLASLTSAFTSPGRAQLAWGHRREEGRGIERSSESERVRERESYSERALSSSSKFSVFVFFVF